MSELSNKIDQVRDILRTDDGISGAMDYTEAISWILSMFRVEPSTCLKLGS